MPITIAKDAAGKILGFIEVSENSVEMLFIEPSLVGKEVSRILLQHALSNKNITRVDENAQNFYKRLALP